MSSVGEKEYQFQVRWTKKYHRDYKMFTQVLYDEEGISKIACLVVTDGNEFREESKV